MHIILDPDLQVDNIVSCHLVWILLDLPEDGPHILRNDRSSWVPSIRCLVGFLNNLLRSIFYRSRIEDRTCLSSNTRSMLKPSHRFSGPILKVPLPGLQSFLAQRRHATGISDSLEQSSLRVHQTLGLSVGEFLGSGAHEGHSGEDIDKTSPEAACAS